MEDKELDIERLWRGWLRAPFHSFLHMDLEEFDREAGTVTFNIPFKEGYKRTPNEEGIHGGVLASIIDIAADFALAVAMNRMGFPTIDLRIDYLRMAGDG
ncbi:MAG: hotdog domain-containing protein, partial [Alphaproteobacteria bacterium]|nr:hotdog domain-containing protein [Alphaproteobacteria bacterium]